MRNHHLTPWAIALSTCLGALLGCGSSTTVEPDRQSSGSGTAAQPPATAKTTAAPTSTASDPAPKVVASEAEMAAVAKGDAQFALALYDKVKGEGNVFLSPASARVALAMAYAGAKGATAEQMARVLALPDGPKTHDAFGALLGLWGSWAGVKVSEVPEEQTQPFTLRVANRLFGQKGRPFLPAYLALLTDKYGAPLEQVDFAAAPEPARQRINQWVEDRTEKRIKDLLPTGSVQPDTRLVLVNAIYFKAQWVEPFAKFRTKEADFFVTATDKVKAPMMGVTKTFRYAETPDVQVVELPYLGAPAAMTIILPKAKDGLARVEGALSPATLDGWIGKLEYTRVDVQMPKIKLESMFRLSQTLGALGMTDALDSKKADFSGMDGTKELFIGEVIQKTFCAVDEDGTEAAAATAVVARAGAAAPSEPPKDFLADHPFLFLIRDTKTGSILFLGRVVKPG